MEQFVKKFYFVCTFTIKDNEILQKATALQVCGDISIVTSASTYLLQLRCDEEELRTGLLNIPKAKAPSKVLCSYILLSDSL